MIDKPAAEDTFELSEDDFPCDLPQGNSDILVDLSRFERDQLMVMDFARSRTNILADAYRKRLLKSQASRRAEFDTFRKAGERIKRTKRGWSAISDRELSARSPEERERARKVRNKKDERARKTKPATPAPAIAPEMITRKAFSDRVEGSKNGWRFPGIASDT